MRDCVSAPERGLLLPAQLFDDVFSFLLAGSSTGCGPTPSVYCKLSCQATNVTMQAHNDRKTVEEGLGISGERAHMHTRHLELKRFFPFSNKDSENESTTTMRPTTLWHVLRIPVHDPGALDGRLYTALPRSSAPKSKVSYQALVSKSDSALVPLLSAAIQPQSISISSSDYEDVSGSLRRSSASSEFDLEPMVVGRSCGITQHRTRAQQFQRRPLDGMYIGTKSERC